MPNTQPFTFTRTKGIVWVCDMVGSSSYLNNNDSVGDMESFIPRLYFVSQQIIESYGGKLLQWTGDGFLAFFELDLDREKEVISEKIFEAAWHLTFLSNVTQLGLKPQRKFKIRHGITYEKDALLMTITSATNVEVINIIGRAVVLAFRLSSIQADFPSIVTTKELTSKSKNKFVKWKPTAGEKLKFFKGEKFGTDSIVISSDKVRVGKSKKIETIRRIAKKGISAAKSPFPSDPKAPINIFVNKMSSGPNWCGEIIKQQAEFIKTNLLGSLERILALIDEKNKSGL